MDPRRQAGAVAPDLAARLIDKALDCAMVTLDCSGTVESWNAGAHRITGYSAEEMLGRSFALLFPEEEQREGLPMELLARARDDGSVEHSGWRHRKDDTRFWGESVVSALHDDNGRVTGFAEMTRDHTDHHEVETALRRSEERFRLLVGEVRDYAIFALDDVGTIESWNVGAERLKGYTTEEVLGRNSSMFYTEEDRRAGVSRALLNRARVEGSVQQTGWRVRKDGTRFWADVLITALTNADGQVTGFAKITRDLSETKRIDEAQRAFYSSFAHDFLTPVAALRGFAELLGDASPQEQETYVRRIRENALRLSAMMDDLVDHARERATETAYQPESLGIAELVDAARVRLGVGFDLERIEVAESSVCLFADRSAMERVLTNVVGNALAYAPNGPVVVVLDACEGHARLTVRDHGRGVDPDDLTTIFDEFQRGRLAAADGGTGLGLASARRLVEQQGGTISMSSEVGIGSVVVIELPQAPGDGASFGLRRCAT